MNVVAFYKALAKVLEEKTGAKIEVKEIKEHGKSGSGGKSSIECCNIGR